MPDIRPAEIGNAAAPAPVLRYRDFVTAEGAVVLGDIADPAEAQARDAAKVLRHMKQQPVHCIEMLGDFLDHDDMARQVGGKLGPDQHRQRGEVESHCGARIEAGFETVLLALEPVERALDRLCPAFAPHVTRQRPVRHASDAMPVQRGEQKAGVGIAEIGLGPRRRVHLRHRLRGDAVRPITAHREPHRIEAGIVGAIEQGGEPHVVATGEMPILGKALFVELQR